MTKKETIEKYLNQGWSVKRIAEKTETAPSYIYLIRSQMSSDPEKETRVSPRSRIAVSDRPSVIGPVTLSFSGTPTEVANLLQTWYNHVS